MAAGQQPWLNLVMLSSPLRRCLSLALLLFAAGARGYSITCDETGIFSHSSHRGSSLTVASVNLAHGRGGALNQLLVSSPTIRENLAAITEVLDRQKADVVALQEADADSFWSGRFNHVEWLTDLGAYTCSLHGVHAESPLFRFGTALLSRVRLYDPRSVSFDPTPPTTTKGMVSASLDWFDGVRSRSVRVVSVHLDFSRNSVRREQAQDILDTVQNAREPLILMGDFNADWDDEDSAVRTLVQRGGLTAWQPGAEGFATYEDKRLDWILLSRHLRFLDYRVIQEELSDHRPVVAEIAFLEEQP